MAMSFFVNYKLLWVKPDIFSLFSLDFQFFFRIFALNKGVPLLAEITPSNLMQLVLP